MAISRRYLGSTAGARAKPEEDPVPRAWLRVPASATVTLQVRLMVPASVTVSSAPWEAPRASPALQPRSSLCHPDHGT